jgi:hypothetical protein
MYPVNIKTFAASHNLRADVKYGADEKAHERMGRDMTPWTVTLKLKGRQMTVPFFTGSLNTREPDAVTVLDCLLSDADGYDNARGFEDWANDYGYDTDSRKAEETYKQVEAQSKELRAFLGDLYNAARDCERL